jgi:type II secretory pathway pseudopilin PulG
MIIHKKPAMTLLEVLIGMSILSFLLVIIFGFFRELTVLQAWNQQQELNTFHQRYVEHRLEKIFANIANESDAINKFIFYIDPPQTKVSDFPSLVLSYINGARLNPTQAGFILARLYVNAQHQLCLVSWPYPQEGKEPFYEEMQKEILMEGIESLKWECFAAPDDQKTEFKRLVWLEEWLYAYKELPVLLKLSLTLQNQEKMTWVFHLPVSEKSNHYIHYP